ncbi:MAG: Panacea domain-containing protein [Planctomycetota bacterium]
MRPSTTNTAIRFDFSPSKSLQAMAYFIGKLGGVDKVALTKLLYVADRDHFISFGYPITGDRQCAMPHGPVPSNSLSVLDGEFGFTGDLDPYNFFNQNGYHLTIKHSPGVSDLSDSEIATLDLVLDRYGQIAKNTWRLVESTHEFPEYKEVFREKTSTLIPYELIIKHYADDRMLRDRPVISQATASHMESPFWGSDSDL